jgi:hypothetical protein
MFFSILSLFFHFFPIPPTKQWTKRTMMKPAQRIDSWKGIAEYINRDVATCMKWARLYGLPIYHIDPKSRRSPVFAYKSEIDNWFLKEHTKKIE